MGFIVSESKFKALDFTFRFSMENMYKRTSTFQLIEKRLEEFEI